MRFTVALSSALALSVQVANCYPGMGTTIAKIKARAEEEEDGGADEGDSFELLGDLKTLPDSQLTDTGKLIKQMLEGKGNPESNEKYNNVPAINSEACKKDTCCIWKYISDDMHGLFQGKNGLCTKWARFAVRLGFHDAGSWNKFSTHGGADGSIVLAGSERLRGENNGLQDIIVKCEQWYKKYNKELGFKSVTMADIIQVAASVATVTCPLGPRMRTFVGRKDSCHAAPNNLLPNVFSDADTLIQLFRDKTIGPHGLVALVGAHSTSQQNFVNETRAGDPQDSTPGVWDVLFYKQTLMPKPPQRVFKFPSDIVLSKHPETRKEWKEFAQRGGQDHWNEDFAREYIRLSLLGVEKINSMTECTKILPPFINGFRNKDQPKVDKWLASTENSEKSDAIAKKLEQGEELPAANEIPGPSDTSKIETLEKQEAAPVPE